MSLKKYKKSDHIISNPSLTEKYPDLLDYSLISILGCGSFGQVIHAQNPETNQDFAIKV